MSKIITFTNKVVVITGAGGVLCGYMAKEFAKAGAKVALLDLNQEAAQTFADEIVAEGGIAKAYKANVLSKENLEEVHQAVLEDLGPTDILVNGAGGNNPKATTDNEFHELDLPSETKTFFELDEAGISFVFNLNYLGTLLPTQVTKIPAYSGAKAAISNFTQWLAVHFSKVGIRCNAIAPGFLVTNQNRSLLFTEDGQPTARAEKILNNTPMGRFGEASELIGGLFFLADEKSSSFVNGVVLPIDGGFAAYSGV